MNVIKPLLSVRLMTYNHEPFIKQAMDGIMMQQTDFPIEVVVGDDFSTDDTLKIIKSYKSTEKIRIRILNRSIGDEYWNERQKKGRLYNFTNILKNCEGRYIALLDGDDYWTDSYKLQTQVDLLEVNSKFVICAHHCNINKDGIEQISPLNNLKSTSFTEVLMYGIGAETLSVVFKKQNIEFPDWFYNCEMGDYPLYVLLLKNGSKVHYLNKTMGVYRVGNSGVWSSLNKDMLANRGIKTFEILDKAFGYKYHKLIKKAIVNRKRKFGQLDYTFIAVLKQETPIKYLVLHLYHKLIKSIKFKRKNLN